MTSKRVLTGVSILFVLATLAACGGGGGDGGGGGGGGGGSGTVYTVGGTVSGLTGTVVLQNNGGDNLTVSANGPFTFSTALNNSTAYAVTVLTQPTGQTCSVGNGAGTVSGANVTNIAVSCTTAIAAVAAGGSHSLALKADGTVWAWGGDGFGQLGNGAPMTDSPTPVQVSGLANVTQIAAGEAHSLALRADGTVWAWGQGGIKQLGDGNIADSPTPVQVSGLTNVTRIAAGRYHNLAGRADGTVWAWGWNFYGQLGNSSNGDSSVPVLAFMAGGDCPPGAVCPAPDVQALAAGSQHSLAQLSDLYVWGWGDNFRGQIGDSIGAAGSTSPRQLGALLNGTGFRQFAAGSEFNMALKMDGTILMWGTNAQDVLGVNLGAPSTPTPTAIPTLSGVTQVTAGFEHALALKSDGTVWGWGRNTYGQVTGNFSIVSTPAQTGFQSGAFLTGVQRIGAGVAASHTLVLKQDGTVWSFGHDGNCKLGRGCTGTTYSRDPVQVVGLLLF